HLGRRHRDDLSRVRRVGQNFLVTGHAGVEDDLASRFAGSARRVSFVANAVFECEYGFHLSSSDPVTGVVLPAATRAVDVQAFLPGSSIRTTCEAMGTSATGVRVC